MLICFLDQVGFWFCFFLVHFFVGWVFLCLSEAGRAPFDFSEGERELVSGFNIEYGGSYFSFIFICEYGMVILISFIRSCFFVGGANYLLKVFFFSFFFIWIRCCFPRFRYDFLMRVA